MRSSGASLSARAHRPALVAALLLGGALAWPRLPDARPADAPPGAFSAARAVESLRAWSGAPRPTGSAAHAAVLDGLEAELRGLGFAVEREAGAHVQRQPVVNLVASAPGAAPTGGVWLVAHTDTVPEAPGAADDGLGLGVVVEAARALSMGGVPAELHVLLTDGEELGLYGARAHVRRAEEAGADATRLVINVEARGTEGPAYMFQLAGSGPALLDAWRASACTAQATSLARAVYEVMPNDTDFTMFRRAGWWGYDFALLGGAWRYHTPDDTVENLSPRSVQQVGDCVLGLARAWLARPGTPAAPDVDRVYFQAFGRTVVLPPWTVRLAGGAALVAFPWRRGARGGGGAEPIGGGAGGIGGGAGRIGGGAIAGIVAWLGALVVAFLGGLGALGAALLVRPDFWDRPAEIVGPGPWYAAAATIGVLAGAAMARLGRGGPGWQLAGVLLGGAAALAVPTAGYVLVPGAWAGVLLARGRPGRALVFALLAGVVTAPVLCAIFPALTTRMLPILAVVPLLLLGWALGPAPPATGEGGPSQRSPSS